jgi:hypothetical protein
MKSVYQNIDKAAECDIKLFWKLIKRQKKRTSRTYSVIHDNKGTIYNDPSGVAEAFVLYYKNIYSLWDHDSVDNSFRCRVENKSSEMEREIPGEPFTTDELLQSQTKEITWPRQDCVRTYHLRWRISYWSRRQIIYLNCAPRNSPIFWGKRLHSTSIQGRGQT